MFESYIGTKRIDAAPMTRGEYAKLSGRNSILTEKGESESDNGYHVRYPDGYESWSPKSAFDAAYRKSGNMTFGHAIELLKLGCKMARKGWNGKGMFLYLIKGAEFQNALKYGYGEYEREPTITSSIAMKTAQNTIVIGWLASQTDMLAEDWHIVE